MSQNVEELFTKYRESGSVELRNRIAEHYLYIAEILAKKFVGRGVAYEDLVQEACVYLLEAIESFDETRGLQFSTYATPTITGKLKNYFRDHARLLKVPRRLSEMNLEIRRFTERFFAETGRKPQVKELAAALSYAEEDVIEALEIGSTLSIDAQVGGKDEGLTLGELLPADEGAFESFELRQTLEASTKDFSKLEQSILHLRFVEALSQTETAARLGISQMTVSRTERKILATLKDRLTALA